MSSPFSIHTGDWHPVEHEAAELAQTTTMLKIVLGNQVVTRNESVWLEKIRDEAYLSAYPLALWFATHWWRLRWEPLPEAANAPPRGWRMAHEMVSAGHGYVWPRMVFSSDGEILQAWSRDTTVDQQSAVRYLTNSYSVIDAEAFERTVDAFVLDVLKRLDATGIHQTDLHQAWAALSEERGDEKLSSQCRLEALLGFDVGECPAELRERLDRLIPEAGAAAAEEVAPICALSNPLAVLEALSSAAQHARLRGRFTLPKLLTEPVVNPQPSWQRGARLARRLRAEMGLAAVPVADATLCGLVGLTQQQVDAEEKSRLPLGLAIQSKGNDQARFLLRKSPENKPGRRFELARMVGDSLIADATDSWLPVTDAKTARQKIQRAFAAEFLCPIDLLKERLDGDYSSDARDSAARHFAVADQLIKTQLVNHRLLPSAVLDDGELMLGYPYTPSARYPYGAAAA